ncbi:HNH endonuclease [Priestia megaterium]
MKQVRIELIKNNYMVNDAFGVIDELEISVLASQFDVSETTIKKDLKEIGCIIYRRKPPKIKELNCYMKELDGLKLKIEKRMPSYVQNKSVRKLIGDTLWGKVREVVLKQNNCCCSACGYTTDDLKGLHVHEEWEIDEDSHVIKLAGLSLLCRTCHSIKHMEYTYFGVVKQKGKSEWEKVIHKLNIHFMKVNQCTQEVLVASKSLSSKRHVLDKLPKFETSEQLQHHFDKQKQLQKANWSYSLYSDMPLREAVAEALQRKVTVLVHP